MICADQQDYKNAFKKHLHAYTNWGVTGSGTSRRLILIYCVECGLKSLLMKQQRIYRVADAQPHIVNEFYSHDFYRLLKSLNQAGIYSFPPISTIHGDRVRPDTYHQLCRYSVRIAENHQGLVNQYDGQLEKIAEWLREQV